MRSFCSARNAIRCNAPLVFYDAFFWLLFDNFIGYRFAANDKNYHLSSFQTMRKKKLPGKTVSDDSTGDNELALLLNNTEEPFLLISRKRKLVLFNRKSEKLYQKYFGVRLKKGADILEYDRPAGQWMHKGLYKKALMGQAQETQLTIHYRSEKKIVRLKYQPARDRRNRIIGVLVSANDVSQQIEHEANLKHTLHALNERIKEQTCLYNISSLGTRDYDVHQLLSEVVTFLPPGWQYPEVAGASIVFEKSVYKTNNFRKSRWMQTVSRLTAEKAELLVQVCYLKKMPEADEGPFLKEERKLINTIADNLVLKINQVRTCRLLHDDHNLLRTLIDNIPDYIYVKDTKLRHVINNKANVKLIGAQSEEETLGKTAIEMFGKKLGGRYLADDRKVLKTGKPILYREEPIVSSTGEERWLSTSKIPLVDKEGSITGLIGISRDITESKRAEAERQRLLEEKNEILESIGDNFYALDEEYRFTYLNRAALHHLHLTRKRAIGKSLFELFPVLTGTLFHQRLEESKSTRQAVRFEFYYPPLDTWFDENIYPKADGFSVFFRDITEKKRAEKALLVAYEEKNTILESIGDAFFTVDRNFTVTYWNRLAETLLRTPRKKILGKNLWDVFSDAVTLPSFNNYHKAMNEQVTVEFEDYYAPVDRWFEVSAYPSANGLSVYFKDITGRKRAEEKVRQYTERFELAAKATNDAIWDWDLASGEVTRTGDGFFNLFGYEITEALHNKLFWYNLVHPDDQEHFHDKRTRALQNPDQTYWEDEYRFKRKDGKYIVVYDRGYIVRDASGRALRMIGATQDITQRKEYENSLKKLSADLGRYAKELADSNAELEQFAYVASHDLQEPLRMISSFLTQLEKKYHDILDEKGKQYIHFAVDGAGRMRQIILDLLEFSRVGRFDKEPEEIDTARLVEEVQSLFMNQISEKQAVVTIRPMPVIRTHRSPLRQVFHNLLGNALKYTHPEVAPHIVIGGEQGDTEYRFFVADNGIGIAPDYFEKIFILFQRLHSNKEYAGTGMGLALCKKIINNMGGRIWVESEEGKGSTFYFSIPKNS
jgi:PAS domain S-box-containing protein